MLPKEKASRSIATERAAEKSKPEKASRSIATERAAEKSKPQALDTQSCAELKKSEALVAESIVHATDELHHTSLHIATLYRAAYANTSPPQQSLLQQVGVLGHYPKRYKQPANKSETASNSLAMKLSKIKGALPPAAQRYLEAMQAVSTATEHAQQAESLMQQVRKLGHLPQESQHKPHEQLLAQQLRKAREKGLLEAFEDELENFASKDAAAAIASTATEHARQASDLMEQVRALGRMPKESHDSKERRLAHDLRKARATGSMTAHEPELTSIAAADDHRNKVAAAMDHKNSVDAFYHEVDAAILQPLTKDTQRTLSMRRYELSAAPPLLQSVEAQAMLEELRWMLARQRDAMRMHARAAVNKKKHARLAARRRSALATAKATLRQWQAAPDKCNCHDFSCWQAVWRLDHLIATTLRASNHHLPGCRMQSTFKPDEPTFICPHCGLVLLDLVRARSPYDLDDPSHHSSATIESDGSNSRVFRKAPIAYFTHGFRIMPFGHANLRPEYDSDDSLDRHESEQARTKECTCADQPRTAGFFGIGIQSTCSYCPSTIEAGVLYGGYECETDRFYWKELTFHHYGDECGLPGPFPGRTSRQWLTAIDESIHKTPQGIEHHAYQQLLKHCSATADYMLHRYRFGISGQLMRGKPTSTTLSRKAPTAAVDLYGMTDYSIFNRFPGIRAPLRLEPDFQWDDDDVTRSWSNLPLDIVDTVTPQVVAKLLIDARTVLGRFPEVHSTIRNQIQRTETRVALLWKIWRSRRRVEISDYATDVPDVDDVAARIRPATEQSINDVDVEGLQRVRAGSATAQPIEDCKGLAWARAAEAALRACHLGIVGVDGWRLFFHKPSKPMSIECQKEALTRAGVYHALEICWEPSCYATEQGLSRGECWWVPRDLFKRVSTLAAAINCEECISIPGYPRADEYPEGCCWESVRDGSEKDPWKEFFVSHVDFEKYNHCGMAKADPQAYRWCSTKLLFDYTPYVTRSDWLHCLGHHRWMSENHARRCVQLKQTCSRNNWYAKSSEIWKHFKPEEWSRHTRLAESLGFEVSGGDASAAAEPYAVFLRSDWARNGIGAKLREMPRPRRKKHYTRVGNMAECWPVPPAELLWVGGTYARHPKHFPEHQQEHAWVYGKLRPLGIQPDSFCSKLHQAGCNRFAPTDLWCGALDDDFQHFPDTLSDTVRAGKLCKYLDAHKLHKSLWYGHALRNKHKHHTSILDHPLPDEWNREFKSFQRKHRPLHLVTAPCFEEVASQAASRGFLDTEGKTAEQASAIAHIHDEDTGDETSGASDYDALE